MGGLEVEGGGCFRLPAGAHSVGGVLPCVEKAAGVRGFQADGGLEFGIEGEAGRVFEGGDGVAGGGGTFDGGGESSGVGEGRFGEEEVV